MSATKGGLPGAIREYGEAMRGDWSGIDGRAIRDDMSTIAQWVEDPAAYPGDREAREQLGVCPFGGGHWWDRRCAAEGGAE